MALSPVSQILRAATRKYGDHLNIIDWVTHERYQPNLAKTGHTFYCFPGENVRTWNQNYAAIPENYVIFDEPALTIDRDYDIILSQNPEVHIPYAQHLQHLLHLPILNIMHTMPYPGYDVQKCKDVLLSICNHHVFISEFSRAAWGFKDDDYSSVIKHGIDIDLFSPGNLPRENRVLVVANDYINRDWALGFSIFKSMILDNHVPYTAIGDTPGFSLPSDGVESVINALRTHRIFLNTSTYSPIPMAVLEAMSCSCAVVSTATCMLPDIIKHGENGLLYPANKPEVGLKYIKQLMEDEEMAKELGSNARQTIIDEFHIDRFVNDWNAVFEDVIEKGYLA